MFEEIARKEQELRVRLIHAHARADELRARAAEAADDIRAQGEAAAIVEARSWSGRETEQARQEAEDQVAQVIAESGEGRGEACAAARDEAVRFILAAVLLSTPGLLPEAPG